MIIIIIIIPPCLATEKLINPRKNRRNQRIYHVTCPFPFQTLFRNPSSVDSIDDEGDRSEKERREESGNEAVVEFARKPGLSYDGGSSGFLPRPSFRVYVHAGRARIHFRFQRLSKATSLLFPLDRRRERERARVENNGEDETEEEVKVEEGGGRGDEG